jgi:hypothetical protein
VLRRRQQEVKYLAERLAKHDDSFKVGFGPIETDIPLVLQPADIMFARSTD